MLKIGVNEISDKVDDPRMEGQRNEIGSAFIALPLMVLVQN